MRGLILLLVLLCGTHVASAAPVTVHARAAGGKWTGLKASDEGGRVTVLLGPDQVSQGAVNLVINKPAWMNLDDDEAPKLAWLRVNDREIKASDSVDLGCLSQFPATMAVGLKDNANPLDSRDVRIDLSGSGPSPVLDASGLGPPKPNGRLSLSIPQLPPGNYALRVSVRDLSPQANALNLTLRFVVLGFAVSQDMQTIRIGTSSGQFLFRAERLKELQVGDATPAYLSTRMSGQHFYIDKIERVETLQETPSLKSIRVHALPGETDKQGDGKQFARLQYDLTLRDDLPCLLVTSRTVNLGPKQGIYSWWGWLPGAKWVDPAGEHEWSGKYADVGAVGWVFLPAVKTENPGIGWLSPHFFGESRFSTMLLYTQPQTVETNTNDAVEIRFALMSATTAEQVAATAEKIRTLGLWATTAPQ